MIKAKVDDTNGFAEWGGYMQAKKSKLIDQYTKSVFSSTKKVSDIFNGVAIFVNGYTNPTAEELKCLMQAHGGIYHHYQVSGLNGPTTHIIASNLPNVKIKHLGNIPIVKPNWITDSISGGKVLDFRKYLLYTNHNHKQPTLNLPVVNKEIEQGTDSAEKCHNAIQGRPTKTAADPGFLAEFYTNSRLHLISTLGAEYKQLVVRLREKSDGKFPSRSKLNQLNGMAQYCNKQTVIMHIDMDCFFVSVGLRNRPDLQGQPVAVTHAKASQNTANRSEASAETEYVLLQKYFPEDGFEKITAGASMSEIACCSYEARKCGIKNGMFLGLALKLCPNLKTIPYDFEGYREVSNILYNTIAAYTLDIEAVSCDEMYVDISELLLNTSLTVEQWATYIRKEIMDATGCPCSTGFGENRLQARVATKKAKPAGQFHLRPDMVEHHMSSMSLADLPGIGRATVVKLNALGLKTCGDVQGISLSRLQAELGHKTGKTLVEQVQGIDKKPLNFEHERKSVSADVNYGIRFKDKTEVLNFLQSLSEEVYKRLQETGMKARCLTLKLLVRAPEAPQETAKFLGCGVCNSINRSSTSGNLICDSAAIYKESKALFDRINASPSELRGVGIQLTKLEKIPPTNTALCQFLQQNCEKGRNQNENVNITNKTDLNKENFRDGVKQTVDSVKIKTFTKEQENKSKDRTTNKLKKKRPNDLNNYFKVQGKRFRKTSDIDISVLNELPLDLQQQVIKEYGLDKKAQTEENINRRNLKSVRPKSYTTFDGLDWDELKPIILNWLQCETKPADIDIIMMGEHFRKCVLNGKIEDVKVMCSFLYRHVARTGLCSWHNAYLTITNMVLDGMQLKYHGTLVMEKTFPCKEHR